MPIPPAVGTITLAWTIESAGKLGTGVVRVWTKYALRDTTDHVILAPSEFIGTVVNGTGSVLIPDPNDADISPQGTPLHVRIDTDVLQDEYDIVIPVGTMPSSTVHLDTLGPAVNPPALVQYALASALLNYLLTTGGTITGPIIWAGTPSAAGHLTTKGYVDSLVVGGSPDATTSSKGIVQLAGDLAGTAAAPTVPALANKQPLDPDLTAIAGLAPSANDVIQFVSGAWGNRSMAQLRTSLALNYSDVTGTVPTSALPPLAINETFVVADQAAMLALTAQRGDMAIRQDNGRTYVLSTDSPGTPADWKEVLAAGQVQSVAGKTGVVGLVKGDVGLGSVDNTPDSAKPVSGPQQTALDTKVDKSTLTAKGAMYVASGAGAPIQLLVGSDGQVPTADATQPGGIKWATPASSGSGDRDLYEPSAAGFAEWTVDPAAVSADFGHPTGWIIMVRFRNRTATSLAELGFAVTSAASGPGAYSGVALYEDGSGVVNRLGQSADAGTQWTSPGPKSVAFTAPITVTPGAYYRAAILFVGSGNGRIAGAPLAILDSLLNAGVRRSTVLTGQSAFPASLTVSSMTTNNALYWLGMK